MQKYFPFLACAFAMLAIPRPVCADPISLVSSSRSILVSVVAGDSTATTPLFDRDVLSNTLGATDSRTGESGFASAFLSSSISVASGTFSGHGATSTSHDSRTVRAGGHAQASYAVAFDLSETQRFDFGANFTSTAAGNDTNRSLWESQLFFFPPGPSPTTAFRFSGSGGQTLSRSGTLLPGRYGFFLNGVSDSFDNGVGSTGLDYTFTLKFSDPQSAAPVPEPASMMLLGGGLAAIAARRKRQGGCAMHRANSGAAVCNGSLNDGRADAAAARTSKTSSVR